MASLNLVDRLAATDRAQKFDRWLAPLLGALAACGFQPLALWPATLLGLAGLIALVAAAPTWRRAALLGWLWGLGHFTLGNNWIAAAFTFQAKMAWWLGWLAVPGLALYLAVYPALAALVGWRFRARPLAMLPAFAGAWIFSEWARGWVFTGFAWNPLGVVALGPFQRPGLASLAPWLGSYGLSGLMLLLAGCWWLVPRIAPRWGQAALALGPVAAMLLPGAAPLGDARGGLPYTLVQPNIGEDRLNDPANYENQFITTALLSLPRDGARRLVLWPESGVPDYLRPGYPAYIYRATTYAGDPVLARWRIGRVIGPGAMLLTGTADLTVSQQGEVTAARNVVTAVDGAGAIRGSYAKAHLVPYGEYLPLRGLLAPLGIDRLVPGDMDFSPGPGPRTLDLGPWGKAGVQICYEIVFSGEVVDRAHRPDFIFNPSNDGWFGSWGPPQHLAQARLRAIEEGLPVLRATVSGISAVVAADGRVRSSLPWGKAGRLDGHLPAALPPTPFARLGNVLPLGWGIGLLALAALAMRRRHRYGEVT